MTTPVLNYLSGQYYLDAERKAGEKHGYYKGEIFAISGVLPSQSEIFSNLFGELAFKWKGKNCKPYRSDVRICIPSNTLYTNPDISIICGRVETTDEHFDTDTNTIVIIEIFSQSTMYYDRGSKFTFYRVIDTLKKYILVDSTNISVEKFIRIADNSWQQTEYELLSDVFSINTVSTDLTLADIYEGVKFN